MRANFPFSLFLWLLLFSVPSVGFFHRVSARAVEEDGRRRSVRLSVRKENVNSKIKKAHSAFMSLYSRARNALDGRRTTSAAATRA